MTVDADLFNDIPFAEPANILAVLPGGPASDSYLLESGGRQMVLRIDKPIVKNIGLDRQAEIEILAVVAGADIGPELVWSDSSRGLLLTEYLEGEPWTPEQLMVEGNLVRLGKLLQKLHTLGPTGKAFRVADRALHYAQELGDNSASRLATRVGYLDEQLKEQAVPAVLCHNDPVAMNVIDSGSLRFIDWEYAGVGDPYFDLAVVAAHHELPDSAVGHLLGAYLGQVASADFDRLGVARELYDSLHLLWLMLVRAAGDASIEQRHQFRRLRRRLDLSGL